MTAITKEADFMHQQSELYFEQSWPKREKFSANVFKILAPRQTIVTGYLRKDTEERVWKCKSSTAAKRTQFPSDLKNN